MKIPKKLKVGAVTYKVKKCKSNSWGECVFKNQTITINKGYVKSDLAGGIVIHEIMEAIKHQNCLKCSHPTLGVFAEQMYTALKESKLLK